MTEWRDVIGYENAENFTEEMVKLRADSIFSQIYEGEKHKKSGRED